MPAARLKRPHERRRVVLILENLPLCRDHRVKKQVEALVARGLSVSVICPKAPGNSAWRGSFVDVHEYPAPPEPTGKLGFVYEYGFSLVCAALLLGKVLLRSGFDVLQACQPPDLFFLLGAPLRWTGKSFVVDQRDPSPELYCARYGDGHRLVVTLLRTLERISYRTADHTISVNDTLRAAAETRGARAVTVVRNGPVLAEAQPRPPRPELKRGRPLLCCFVGIMGRQDNVEIVVRAVHHLVHRLERSDFQVAVVGDGESLSELRNLTQMLGLDDWITFTGWLDSEEVFAYLSTADLGLEPNVLEAWSPVKAMEYMAFGVPVVAFDLTETRTLTGDAAAYAQPGDVAGFASMMQELMDDPERRARMGRLGRERIATTFAWEHQREAYLSIFDRLLPEGHRNGRTG